VHAVDPCIDLDRVIYDDSVFYATLVSMGCMGVIYSLVLEAVPQYGVREATVKTDWQQLKLDAGVPRNRLADPLTREQPPTSARTSKLAMAFSQKTQTIL
jgi:hypothetical protein